MFESFEIIQFCSSLLDRLCLEHYEISSIKLMIFRLVLFKLIFSISSVCCWQSNKAAWDENWTRIPNSLLRVKRNLVQWILWAESGFIYFSLLGSFCLFSLDCVFVIELMTCYNSSIWSLRIVEMKRVCKNWQSVAERVVNATSCSPPSGK